jgi:hypothetical protein
MLSPSTGYSLDENVARRTYTCTHTPPSKEFALPAWWEKPHTYASWFELNFGNEWRQDMISVML